jgi:hypothetical protein
MATKRRAKPETPVAEAETPSRKRQKSTEGVAAASESGPAERREKVDRETAGHSIVEETRTVRDLTASHGIREGSKIEVLWTIEDMVSLRAEKVWWPAVVLKPTGKTVLLQEDSDSPVVEVIDTPIKYDVHERFPEWTTDEDLNSSVALIHDHVLIENGIGKGTFWRHAGTAWTTNQMQDMAGKVSAEKDVPQELAYHFICAVAVPFFDEHKHLLNQSQRERFCAKIVSAKEEFIRLLQEKARGTPGYLACLTDEELLAVLKQMGQNLA